MRPERSEYFVGEKQPRCKMHGCFANKLGRCMCLIDNKFKGSCPFYKLKSDELETWEE